MEYTNLHENDQFERFQKEIQSYNNFGYYNRSVVILSNAIGCFPNHPGLYYLLALTYYNSKEYLKATECLKNAINYDEKNNKYLGLIGCCLFNTGDYENAFNYSRKAFELDNRNLDAIVTLGKIELFRHNYNEAYMYINLAVEIDDNNYKAIRLLSKYYIAKEDDPKKVLEVLYASQKLGNDEELDLDIIKFLYILGEYTECLKRCKYVITNHSNAYVAQKATKFVSEIYNEVMQSKSEMKKELSTILNEKENLFKENKLIEEIKQELDFNNGKKEEDMYSILDDPSNEIYEKIEKANIIEKDSKNNKSHKNDITDSENSNDLLKESLDKLNSLIGLDNVKGQIQRIVQLIKYERNRADILEIEENINMSYHFAFLGNPGTGKTTVARLIGDIFHNLGILEKGQLIEVDRSNIVGRFIGETAKLTQKAIDNAMGGILFIDEAYSLAKGGSDSNDYGSEAIDTLIKAMEDNRDKFTVILAGYTNEMNKLIKLNPGLKSRINLIIEFNDYSDKELLEIAKSMAEKDYYKLSKKGEQAFIEKINKEKVDENFANARVVRNIIENAIREKAFRIGDKKVSKKQLTILEPKDFGVNLSFNRKEKMNSLKKELYNLIGLDEVKRLIEGVVDTLELQYKKRNMGLKTENISLNMIFSGNPGTGKTSVARVLSKILKEIGVLKKGHMIEVTRTDLVGQYVGQTAPKTLEKIKEAYGGILFIDEAYSLNGGGENDFGREALATIIKEMEDNRDKLVIIMAGYTKEMQELMELNPGFKSRIKFLIEFPDYNDDELMAIFMLLCKKEGYMIEKSAQEKLKEIFKKEYLIRDKHFGNGRLARKYYEKIKMNQASRIIKEEIDDKIQIMNIKKEDLENI